MVTLGPKHPSMGDMLDRILEGVTIEADFRVLLGDDYLLGMKNRLIPSSFNTAAELDLGFPKGTDFGALGWLDLVISQRCPVCGMKSKPEYLDEYGRSWCGRNYATKEE
jgi:hypothetical protein